MAYKPKGYMQLQPVMSFTEIALALGGGMTRQAVFQSYQSAMKKLRMRRIAFVRQQRMAHELEALRDRRQVVEPDWNC